MRLDEFLGSEGASEALTAGGAVSADPAPSDAPTGVAEVTTPTGVHIYYQSGPKRLYRVNNVEVPSVTEVLGVLDKPALPWWGMKVGVAGVLELGEATADCSTVDEVVDLLTKHKLTVNHVRDKAGDRGVSVHNALERWAFEGIFPDPDDYPDEERGYVVGVSAFLREVRPEPVAAEVMVGSVEHGFAGRFDLLAVLEEPREVVVKCGLKRGPRRAVIPAGVVLLDLKTSSGVYPSHMLQLAGYKIGQRECGYQLPDYEAVVWVSSDGEYEVRRNVAVEDDFLSVKAVYDSLLKIKEWAKAA